jgi:hypothetical protein
VSLAAITSGEQIVTTLAAIIGFKFHSDLHPKQRVLGEPIWNGLLGSASSWTVCPWRSCWIGLRTETLETVSN